TTLTKTAIGDDRVVGKRMDRCSGRTKSYRYGSQDSTRRQVDNRNRGGIRIRHDGEVPRRVDGDTAWIFSDGNRSRTGVGAQVHEDQFVVREAGNCGNIGYRIDRHRERPAA